MKKLLSAVFIFIYVAIAQAQTQLTPASIESASKINDTTIELVKVVPEVRTTVRHSRTMLELQKKQIQEKMTQIIAPFQKQLADIEAMLAECDKLGIK